MAYARESNSTCPLKKWLEKPQWALTQVALKLHLLQNMFPEKMCE